VIDTTTEIENKTSFSELLDDYDFIRPRRGQIVHGEVIALTKEAVILDVGAKRDAIVPSQELARLDELTTMDIGIGDRLPVYITSTSGYDNELLVSIERGLEQHDWEKAEIYLQNGEILRLKVSGYNRGGLLVEFGRLQGFVPNSLVPGLPRGRNQNDLLFAKSEMVNKNLAVKVIKVDKGEKRLVLSAKAAESERRKKRLQELHVGEILTGTVANVVDFGVFVDLNGVDGLIHKSRLSWDHVSHPREVLQPGEEVRVVIKDVDVDNERISLDRRALLPDPWEKFAAEHQSGDVLEGIVEGVVDFGAFVKLNDHVTGLVHASELYQGISHSPTEVLHKGDRVLVRIIEINTDERRVSLSMRRVPPEEIAHWIIGKEEPSGTEDDTEPSPEPVQE
jgi:small subunit ribosomal protein S1